MRAAAARLETAVALPSPPLVSGRADRYWNFEMRERLSIHNRPHRHDCTNCASGLPETHFLLFEFGRGGIAFDETEPGFSREECCRRVASQDHVGQPVAVYRASENRFEDVSEDIARQALEILLAGDWLFENGFENPHPLPDFISLHCPDAQTLVWEAARDRDTRDA